MALEDFAQNLRLLCSYGRSVTDICRRLDINRQQFNRYLTGKTKPSLHTVRRISDFFGIDDHEIFMDYNEFQELIRLRPPRLDQTRNPLHGFFERLCQSPEQPLRDNEKYLGYYFYYFQPSRLDRLIYRNLLYFFKEGDLVLSKQIERYPNSEPTLPRVIKHEGVVYAVSDRLVLTEREEEAGSSLWHSIFYSSDYRKVTFLSGLSLGVTPENAHEIICYRALLEFLGTEIDVKGALRKCGSFQAEDPEIGDYVKHCVDNHVEDGASAMAPRY